MEQVADLIRLFLTDLFFFGLFGFLLAGLMPEIESSEEGARLRKLNRNVVVILAIITGFAGLGFWLGFSEPSHVQVGVEDHVPIKKDQDAFRLNQDGEYVFDYNYKNVEHLSNEKVDFVLVDEDDDRAGTTSGVIVADGKVDPLSGIVVWVDKSKLSFRPDRVYLSQREIAEFKNLDSLPRNDQGEDTP